MKTEFASCKPKNTKSIHDFITDECDNLDLEATNEDASYYRSTVNSVKSIAPRQNLLVSNKG